jgi:NAD(P)-dependent dehydrogenase (short-subunit alcohol dehydrogenase family)
VPWTADDIPDLDGKVAVVTGANGGLGLETARALARRRAHVVMAARNLDKAEEAAAAIRSGIPDASLELQALDLASLESVRDFTSRLDHDRVDILVNNAGVMGIPEQATSDGFEMQLGVNHLGLLLPRLSRARVVTVTSTARHFGRPVDPDNPHLHGTYDPWKAYGQSKLANLHFAVGLQSRFETTGWKAASLVAHPGLSNTDLQSNSVRETGGGGSQRFFETLAARTGMTAERGALSQLRAATDPTVPGGSLVAPRYGNAGPPEVRPLFGRSKNTASINTLWVVSERETGVVYDFAGRH